MRFEEPAQWTPGQFADVDLGGGEAFIEQTTPLHWAWNRFLYDPTEVDSGPPSLSSSHTGTDSLEPMTDRSDQSHSSGYTSEPESSPPTPRAFQLGGIQLPLLDDGEGVGFDAAQEKAEKRASGRAKTMPNYSSPRLNRASTPTAPSTRRPVPKMQSPPSPRRSASAGVPSPPSHLATPSLPSTYQGSPLRVPTLPPLSPPVSPFAMSLSPHMSPTPQRQPSPLQKQQPPVSPRLVTSPPRAPYSPYSVPGGRSPLPPRCADPVEAERKASPGRSNTNHNSSAKAYTPQPVGHAHLPMWDSMRSANVPQQKATQGRTTPTQANHDEQPDNSTYRYRSYDPESSDDESRPPSPPTPRGPSLSRMSFRDKELPLPPADFDQTPPSPPTPLTPTGRSAPMPLFTSSAHPMFGNLPGTSSAPNLACPAPPLSCPTPRPASTKTTTQHSAPGLKLSASKPPADACVMQAVASTPLDTKDLDVERVDKDYFLRTTLDNLVPMAPRNPGGPQPRTLIFFLRHFLCGLCQDYVRESLMQIDAERLQQLNISLLIVSHGSAGMIDVYGRKMQCDFEIVSDPRMQLYKLFEFAPKPPKGGPRIYHSPNAIASVLKGVVWGFTHLPWTKIGWPKIGQLGGEAILRRLPDGSLECEFLHRMGHPLDHIDAVEIAKLACVRALAEVYVQTPLGRLVHEMGNEAVEELDRAGLESQEAKAAGLNANKLSGHTGRNGRGARTRVRRAWEWIKPEKGAQEEERSEEEMEIQRQWEEWEKMRVEKGL